MPAISAITQVLVTNGGRQTIVDDHQLSDIVKGIVKYHKRHRPQYDKIAHQFWQGDARRTAQTLFNFQKRYVKNVTEGAQRQTIKSPGRILADGVGDCKHYSSFINGVCDSLSRQGYPIKALYRFTADRPGEPVHHVFSVVSDKSGHDYWVDPVLGEFNRRPKFHNVTDIDMLEYLSGTTHGGPQSGTYNRGSIEQVIGKSKFLESIKKGVQHVAHGALVNLQNIQKGVKKVEHGIEVNAHNAAKGVKEMSLKVGLVPARKAFLALVALNIHGIANKLFHTLKDKNLSAELMHKWQKTLGGDPKTLVMAISNGNKRRRIGYHGYIGVAGVDDATVAAWLALASAVIAVLAKFMKQSPDEQKAMADQAKEGVANLATAATQAAQATPETYNAAAEQAAATAAAATDTPPGAMNVTTGVNAQGQPQIMVHDMDHPVADRANNGAPAETDDPGNLGPDAPESKPAKDFKQLFHDTTSGIITFVKENKLFFGMIIGGFILYKIATRPRRKRRVSGTRHRQRAIVMRSHTQRRRHG